MLTVPDSQFSLGTRLAHGYGYVVHSMATSSACAQPHSLELFPSRQLQAPKGLFAVVRQALGQSGVFSHDSFPGISVLESFPDYVSLGTRQASRASTCTVHASGKLITEGRTDYKIVYRAQLQTNSCTTQVLGISTNSHKGNNCYRSFH